MSERRPEAAGRRSARVPVILSVLLLAAAGALVWLHVSGRLQPLLATSPRIAVELPASVVGGGAGLASDRAPDATEPAPSAGAELTPIAPAAPSAAAPEAAEPGPAEPSAAGQEPAESVPPPAAAAPAPAESGAAALGEAAPAPAEASAPAGSPSGTAADAAVAAMAEEAAEPFSEPLPETAEADAEGTGDAAPDGDSAETDAAKLAAAAADQAPPPAPPAPALAAEPEPEPVVSAPGATEEGLSARDTGAAPPAASADLAPAAPTGTDGAAPADTEAAASPQVAAATVPPGVVPTWQRLARPFPPDENRPRIAVVVAGLGLSDAATTAAIQQLPAEITLSFSPYSNRIEEWVGMARAAGHEVLIDLPMEPASFPRDDPGPQALLTSLSEPTNAERLGWILSRTDGFLGVATFMGSRFTTSAVHMRPVLSELKRRGLLIVDSRSAADSLAASLAAEAQVAYAINDRFIDNEASRVAIDGRLQQIERIARTRGVAVAMGYAYPVTIERLREWVRGLPGKGLSLAPISAAADRQELR